MPSPVEVDPLITLHEAMLAAGRSSELVDRLRPLANALATIGGGATTLVVRDESLRDELTVRALPAAAADDVAEARPMPPVVGPAVWRRWLRLLKARHAQLVAGDAHGAAYALDLADAWVRAEFGQALCGIPADGRAVGAPAGLLVAPLAGRDGAVVATLVQEVPNAWPPEAALVRAAELIGQQVVHHVADARLEALAARRADRLQRLQEAGAALGRSLDEHEIVRELARHVLRLVPADGIVVAHPDLERGVVRTTLRQVRGLSCPRVDQPLGSGPLAEAARTGLTVRVDDYDAARSPLAAADDVVGDGGPAGAVIATPMRVGTQLVGVVAVHAAAARAFRTEDEELLRALAAQAGTAIANARLFAESDAERRQSEALAEVARAVGASLRFGEVMRLVLRHTSALLRAGGACVALQREDYLHIVAGVGSASLLSGVHVPVASSMLGRALRDAQPHISNRVADDDAYYRPLKRITSIEKAVLVPLIGAEGPIGVIVALNREADFTEADARVLQRLADHVAVAIANARLFEEVTSATREWKVAFDTIAAGMVVLDDQGRVVRCNQRAAELTGAPNPKMLLGRDFREAAGLAPSDPSSPDVVAQALERGETARGTAHAVDRAAWLDVLAAPHPDGGAVVTFDDVTAHQIAREALAASEARYRELFESASDAIFTVDARGRLTSINHAIERATGRSRAELLGLPCEVLSGREDAALVAELLAATLRGESVRREVRFHDVHGSLRTGSLVAAPVVEGGRVIGALGVLRDVTDELRRAEQLMQRQKLATVGRLVRGISHELDNPLASVLALADLLVSDAEAAEQGGVAAPTLDPRDVGDAALAIRAEARRAARIIGRLHAFAKQRAPEQAATDLNRVVLDALDLRRYALRMQQVDIEVDLDYELPVTWADPVQLQEVFLQIVTTAELALGAVPDAPGARRLTIRTRRRGDVLEATFVDTGVGYAPDAVARLLEPFGADDDGAADLAASAEIVRVHGGRIHVESAPGAGATVLVELPFVPPPTLGAGPLAPAAPDAATPRSDA